MFSNLDKNTIRNNILNTHSYTCRLCKSSSNLEVFNRLDLFDRNYYRFYEKEDGFLIVLCLECSLLWTAMYNKVKLRKKHIKKIKKRINKGMDKFKAFDSLPTKKIRSFDKKKFDIRLTRLKNRQNF